jgi:hypothetical protein
MTGEIAGAPQPVGGMSAEETERALGLLRLVWGGSGYGFGYDPDLACWWAVEGGKIGSLLKAGSPEELGRLLAEQEVAGL